MEHAIVLVDDDALPEGHDFVFVGMPDGGGMIFYRRSALDVEPLEDSWTAYRALIHTPPIPTLRRAV
jgi:hypothetical protein